MSVWYVCKSAFIWVMLLAVARSTLRTQRSKLFMSLRCLWQKRCPVISRTGFKQTFHSRLSFNSHSTDRFNSETKPNKVVWSRGCNSALKQLKQLLCSRPVRSPDFKKKFILQTDALDYGVSAILSLLDDHQKDHLIAYFSRKLLDWETCYSTIEDYLAIKLGIQAFSSYLTVRNLRSRQITNLSLGWINWKIQAHD